MVVKQQLMKEIEDLPLDAQEKVLKLVHFVKEEIFVLREKISKGKKRNALADVDKIAIETGMIRGIVKQLGIDQNDFEKA